MISHLAAYWLFMLLSLSLRFYSFKRWYLFLNTLSFIVGLLAFDYLSSHFAAQRTILQACFVLYGALWLSLYWLRSNILRFIDIAQTSLSKSVRAFSIKRGKSLMLLLNNMGRSFYSLGKLVVALLLAASIGTWTYYYVTLNRYQYVGNGFMRVDKISGETQRFDGKWVKYEQ